jgi:small GTP-binding protein
MTSIKSAFSGPKYKIILVGDSGVGKTSIFWHYIHNEVSTDHPMTTIDFRYKMIKLHDKLVKLCIWDTAGQ